MAAIKNEEGESEKTGALPARHHASLFDFWLVFLVFDFCILISLYA